MARVPVWQRCAGFPHPICRPTCMHGCSFVRILPLLCLRLLAAGCFTTEQEGVAGYEDAVVVKLSEEDFEGLENDQLLVQSMVSSRYLATFEREVRCGAERGCTVPIRNETNAAAGVGQDGSFRTADKGVRCRSASSACESCRGLALLWHTHGPPWYAWLTLLPNFNSPCSTRPLQITYWQRSLLLTGDVVALLGETQRLWSYLEPLFLVRTPFCAPPLCGRCGPVVMPSSCRWWH
jgi:hypothetical protein